MSNLEIDWRSEGRAEMFAKVIEALELLRSDVADNPYQQPYVRYLDGQIFPFLEAERRSAQRVPEGGGEVVRLRLAKLERG